MISYLTTALSLLSLLLLAPLISAAPNPNPNPNPGLLPLVGKIPILDALIALGAAPPPKLLQTVNPSPECAAINQGELQCCRAMVAGDIQLVVWLAKVYGYDLNPNDINGLNCKWNPEFWTGKGWWKEGANDNTGDKNITSCPGVKVCCQVTALVSDARRLKHENGQLLTNAQNPLLSLWCQDA